jgi:hypothetical protein
MRMLEAGDKENYAKAVGLCVSWPEKTGQNTENTRDTAAVTACNTAQRNVD